MADSAPQVSPPAEPAPTPAEAPASTEHPPSLPPPAVPAPVASEAPAAPPAAPSALPDDAREKEAHDAAAPVALPPEGATMTRTFTTHGGDTITVAELPNAATHPDVPATVPMTAADHTVIKESKPAANVPPVKYGPAEPDFPPEPRGRDLDHDPGAPITKDFSPRPRSVSNTTITNVSAPSTKTQATETTTTTSHPLSAVDPPVGIFSQYIAKAETALTVDTKQRSDGMKTQTFSTSTIPLFTLDCRPGSTRDRELRDMSRMFILGIHKRRFRRRQW